MATFGVFWFQTSARKLLILPDGLVGFPYSLFETTKLQDEQPGHRVSTVPQSTQVGSEVRQDSCSKSRKSYFIGGKAVGVGGVILRLHLAPPLKTNSVAFPLSSTPSRHTKGRIFLYLTSLKQLQYNS